MRMDSAEQARMLLDIDGMLSDQELATEETETAE